ncbi:UDP-glucose 6-dehydrogenase [Candidatus Uhrbacteria bacterium CG11_big_fil_rev_8_21_14_0_20_41_9]|nr:MAG: UDP-glucose 6-dehydrogenase [Candidatus Uhrbacteria bacterium CG11_big_fil_rev_8_21_14_0_20_41_9]
MKISVIGTGYVGLTQGACLAHLGHDVFCVDLLQDRVDALNRGELPMFEEGLQELVEKGRAEQKIKFTTNLKEALAEKPAVVFVCVQTPSYSDGTCDLSYIERVLHQVGPLINASTLVVIKSTVPPGTSDAFHSWLGNNDIQIGINPEFLRQGTSVRDFLHPDRIVIGTESKAAETVLRRLHAGIDAPVIATNVNTAQMIKYTANSMLALRLSFMNEIANIADIMGGDIKKIEEAVGLDPRIGSKFLRASAGFGGSCFPKDVLALHHAGVRAGYTSKLIAPIIHVNNEQPLRFVNKISTKLGGLRDRELAVWGLTFNKGTDDVRHSPAMRIVQALRDEGARLRVFDPQGMDRAKELLHDSVTFSGSAMEAVNGAEALLVLTEWPEFEKASWQEVKAKLNRTLLFDGKNYLPHEKIRELGFEVYGIGLWQPPVQ